MKKLISWMVIPCILAAMAACSTPGDQPVKGQGETMAAYTMVAVLTQSAYETVAAKLTEVSALVTPQPGNANSPEPGISQTPPAGTPKPQVILTPFPAGTYVPPSGTACNMAQYVRDVTVPDGTGFNAGQKFTKTWRVKNVGSCTWNTGYKVIYSGGADIGTSREVPLTVTVLPGDETDISVNMVSPNLAGVYNSYWQFQSQDNQVFGIGPKAAGVLYVQINVGSGYSHANTAFYLGSSACSAGWFTNNGILSCPSTLDSTKGGVSPVTSVVIEGGYKKSLPAIIMLPPDGKGGTVSGQFPSYQVQPGDHFKATIGCVDGYPKCVVTFQLSYIAQDKTAHSLGSWGQTEDAYVDQLDFDLSSQAGTTIQMILTVTNSDGSNLDDHAVWVNPVIQPN